ncbi:hypothetical protein ASPVEDRAFT_73058 [Aspergillus versicolor CBS 583.65]|uniref:Uncharacterized protein n=1 Tax=Aspergillus versicolor CBS 583.65 TaxID=1036611 RepID=A0A1L9PPA8_ASPVE|nr:uncharacterized protein ASPVEDRAFT_73058 [Aspergillus versicolor CBS 583.65]OJJ03343.1 hypothetical protein ASPVEDRAFT_73058 [Aspergillus versicolor CBS 583.65]
MQSAGMAADLWWRTRGLQEVHGTPTPYLAAVSWKRAMRTIPRSGKNQISSVSLTIFPLTIFLVAVAELAERSTCQCITAPMRQLILQCLPPTKVTKLWHTENYVENTRDCLLRPGALGKFPVSCCDPTPCNSLGSMVGAMGAWRNRSYETSSQGKLYPVE